MLSAKEEILTYLKDEVKSARAEERTKAYFADLTILKEFLDTQYGGVRNAVGEEYDCEITIYKYCRHNE